jgi:hypothetical protein
MDVDLLALAKEGWKARQKRVKGRNYISLRRGTREKGLGPYNEALWSQLQDLGMTSQKDQYVTREHNDVSMVAMQKQIDELKVHYEEKMSELRRYLNKRLRSLAKQQKTKPVYLQDIIWLEDGSETTMLDEFVDSIVDDVIELEGLNKKINLVEKKIDEFSIMDLAGSVVCPQCGEEGLVSIQIQCNACGVRMGMGWYPSAS